MSANKPEKGTVYMRIRGEWVALPREVARGEFSSEGRLIAYVVDPKKRKEFLEQYLKQLEDSKL